MHSGRCLPEVECPASHLEVMAGYSQRGVVTDPELAVVGVGGPPPLPIETIQESLDDVEVPAQTP